MVDDDNKFRARMFLLYPHTSCCYKKNEFSVTNEIKSNNLWMSRKIGQEITEPFTHDMTRASDLKVQRDPYQQKVYCKKKNSL